MSNQQTPREAFLAQADTLIPWIDLAGEIEPHYPRQDRGRPRHILETMIRLHLVRTWWGVRDVDAVDLARSCPHVRAFCRIEPDQTPPSARSLSRFRRLLACHEIDLQTIIQNTVESRGWRIYPGLSILPRLIRLGRSAARDVPTTTGCGD